MRGAEKNELCWLSMADLGRMIATKEVSPVEVVRAHLERIATLDAGLRAFITVCADAALQAARLAGAGAIVLGKLNMHEFAYGPEGLNAHYGDARNPWDSNVHRVTGGSSSGSGVAVAAG